MSFIPGREEAWSTGREDFQWSGFWAAEQQPAQSSTPASAASKASQEAPAGKGPAINVSSVKNKENLEVWVHSHGLGWCPTSSSGTKGHQCEEEEL